jgi:hypothetical protein
MFYPKIPNVYKVDAETHQTTTEFADPRVEYLLHNSWYALEKIDGMNFCINWDGYKVSYTGRTANSAFSPAQREQLDGMLLSDKFEVLCEQVFGEKEATVFAEYAGGSIQKGAGLSKDTFLICYDVVINGNWLSLENAVSVVKALGLDFVHYVEYDSLSACIEDIRRKRITQSFYNPEAPIEGFVCRPTVNLTANDSIRVKVKCKMLCKQEPTSKETEVSTTEEVRSLRENGF